MTKETRTKFIKVRLTPIEHKLAQKLALNKRITVSDLFRNKTLKEEIILDNNSQLQLIETINRTLLQVNKYLAENSKPEETCKLLQQIKDELNKARALINNNNSINPSV